MKVREVLFHTIPCLFGFLPHSEAVAEIPDGVVKNRVIPLQFCNITITQYDEIVFAIHWLPTLGLLSSSLHGFDSSSMYPFRCLEMA